MDEFVTRRELDEYKARLEDQKKRWDKRLEILEDSVKQIHTMSVNIEKLAVSMERMTQVQAEQNERLKVIENRDGEMWRKAVGYVVTTIGGLLLGLLFNRLGF